MSGLPPVTGPTPTSGPTPEQKITVSKDGKIQLPNGKTFTVKVQTAEGVKELHPSLDNYDQFTAKIVQLLNDSETASHSQFQDLSQVKITKGGVKSELPASSIATDPEETSTSTPLRERSVTHIKPENYDERFTELMDIVRDNNYMQVQRMVDKELSLSGRVSQQGGDSGISVTVKPLHLTEEEIRNLEESRTDSIHSTPRNITVTFSKNDREEGNPPVLIFEEVEPRATIPVEEVEGAEVVGSTEVVETPKRPFIQKSQIGLREIWNLTNEIAKDDTKKLKLNKKTGEIFVGNRQKGGKSGTGKDTEVILHTIFNSLELHLNELNDPNERLVEDLNNIETILKNLTTEDSWSATAIQRQEMSSRIDEIKTAITGKAELKEAAKEKIPNRSKEQAFEELLDPENTNFHNEFLNTYRYYCTTKELFTMLSAKKTDLLEKFKSQTDEDAKATANQIQHIEKITSNWVNNPFIRDRKIEVGAQNAISEILSKSILSGFDKEINPLLNEITTTTPTEPPNGKGSLLREITETVKAKNKKRVKMDAAAEKMAEDLFKRNAAIFQEISTEELTNQVWSKDPSKAPNVNKMINNFNDLNLLLSETFLYQEDIYDIKPKTLEKIKELEKENTESSKEKLKKLNNSVETKRRDKAERLIEFYTLVIEKCIEKGDLHSATAIDGALKNSAIGRISPNKIKQFPMLVRGEKNFIEMRAYMQERIVEEKPTIPYIGLFSSDFTFTEDGNPNDTEILIRNEDLGGTIKVKKPALKEEDIESTEVEKITLKIKDEKTKNEETIEVKITDLIHEDEKPLEEETINLLRGVNQPIEADAIKLVNSGKTKLTNKAFSDIKKLQENLKQNELKEPIHYNWDIYKGIKNRLNTQIQLSVQEENNNKPKGEKLEGADLAKKILTEINNNFTNRVDKILYQKSRELFPKQT